MQVRKKQKLDKETLLLNAAAKKLPTDIGRIIVKYAQKFQPIYKAEDIVGVIPKHLGIYMYLSRVISGIERILYQAGVVYSMDKNKFGGWSTVTPDILVFLYHMRCIIRPYKLLCSRCCSYHTMEIEELRNKQIGGHLQFVLQ